MTETGVFIVSKKNSSIVRIEAPKQTVRDRKSRFFLFYDRENGEAVRIPGPEHARIEIEDLFRGRKKDEPISWKNDYEVVLTKAGYVLVGADVRRGIQTGLSEYPAYWYDSLESAREDYLIGNVSLLEEERKEGPNGHDVNSLIEALGALERDALTERQGN